MLMSGERAAFFWRGEQMSESHRVALVTGASRGLGEVIAGVLVERGHDLVIGARDGAALDRVAGTLNETGNTSRVVAVDGDITDPLVRGRLVDAARQLGGLDLLINNASELGGIGPLPAFDVQRFGRVFPVNVGAPMALIQLAVPLLTARHGLIVNITSDAASGAYAGWGPYGASKSALELLTRTLAIELRDHGVSAVLVDPGDMRTRMHQEAFPREDISDRPLPDVTVPFWHWLFDQNPMTVSGERYAAQREGTPWQRSA
jgi:NAD(P)-dependent dehydrogenase (short-subunit alcohol dehydrogenase family)